MPLNRALSVIVLNPLGALALALAVFVPSSPAQSVPDALPALIELLASSKDEELNRDVLRGISRALESQRTMAPPEGWAELEGILLKSESSEIRDLTDRLSLKFRSDTARRRFRSALTDSTLDVGSKRAALQALLDTRDPELPTLLPTLLRVAPALRRDVITAISSTPFDGAPESLVAIYDDLNAQDRQLALNTLASRPQFARTLPQALDRGQIPSSALSASLVRQLAALNEPAIDATIAKYWGAVRETPEAQQALIAKYRNIYRAGGSTPGDAPRGRVVYTRLCSQCHSLFGTGGNIGPDLTGSNRGDLEYLLENMVAPNAVVPNEYQMAAVETTDFRVLTGVVDESDPQSVSVQTVAGAVRLPRNEVASINRQTISMMPEGLLTSLKDQELRDLIYYLRSPAQATLPATPETTSLFFNGNDLSYWNGDPSLWAVEDGAIVGRTESGLNKNDFLISDFLVTDFRLIFEARLTPNIENSGVQFRSLVEPSGSIKGYQADIGEGWWGKLYHEHGRALLWDRPGDAFVRKGEWNRYEILAVGSKIQTAINGNLCVDMVDPEGERSGIIAVQLHSGGPMEIRFRNLQLEANPDPQLKTLEP